MTFFSLSPTLLGSFCQVALLAFSLCLGHSLSASLFCRSLCQPPLMLTSLPLSFSPSRPFLPPSFPTLSTISFAIFPSPPLFPRISSLPFCPHSFLFISSIPLSYISPTHPAGCVLSKEMYRKQPPTSSCPSFLQDKTQPLRTRKVNAS